MFAVDHVLVSDELLDAPFACHLGACHGGCCVQGDAGAPLASDERAALERALPRVRKYLAPEALDVIEQAGVWEEVEPGRYATTCVGAGGPCVFVTYEGPVAKCGIEKAYHAGRVDFVKPLSCHLYPIRVTDYGDLETLNYERIALCDPARLNGCRKDVQLADFLKAPLERKYGAAWYTRFHEAYTTRRRELGKDQLPAEDCHA